MRTKSRLHAVDITSRSGEPSPFMHPRAADALAIAALTREPRPPALEGSAIAARSFLILLMVPLLVLGGMFGYRWMFSATPVTQETALQMFRAQSRAAEAPARDKDEGRTQAAKRSKPNKKAAASSRSRSRTTVAAAAATSGTRSQTRAAPETRTNREETALEPSPEGVYSWTTNGYESVNGARRQFPEESQRIITHDGPSTYTSHHYFSEQREIWTQFDVKSDGLVINYQRNKVTFGPVTDDSTIHFNPQMRVGYVPFELGHTWKGSWEGKTHGTYDGRVFERTTLVVGGERVEVWGVEMHIHLRGEQNGDVVARVWSSPEHNLSVKEQYVQDVEKNGSYHAEWTMMLDSLDPRR